MDNVLTPRKIILAGQYSLDDAIDLLSAECNVHAYRLTRDEKFLRFREGTKPTRFVVQHLSQKFIREAVSSLPNDEEKWALCFRASCHFVELGTEVQLREGEEPLMRVSEKTLVEWKSGAMVAPLEWIADIAKRFGGEAVSEVGKIAWEMTRLRSGADGPFVWP